MMRWEKPIRRKSGLLCCRFFAQFFREAAPRVGFFPYCPQWRNFGRSQKPSASISRNDLEISAHLNDLRQSLVQSQSLFRPPSFSQICPLSLSFVIYDAWKLRWRPHYEMVPACVCFILISCWQVFHVCVASLSRESFCLLVDYDLLPQNMRVTPPPPSLLNLSSIVQSLWQTCMTNMLLWRRSRKKWSKIMIATFPTKRIYFWQWSDPTANTGITKCLQCRSNITAIYWRAEISLYCMRWQKSKTTFLPRNEEELGVCQRPEIRPEWQSRHVGRLCRYARYFPRKSNRYTHSTNKGMLMTKVEISFRCNPVYLASLD